MFAAPELIKKRPYAVELLAAASFGLPARVHPGVIPVIAEFGFSSPKSLTKVTGVV